MDGWGVHLAGYYDRRAEVVVRGFAGYTSRMILPALGAALPPGGAVAAGLGPVGLVIIMLGTNDCVEFGQGHVPLQEYRANLSAIIKQTRLRYGQDVGIVLMSPPPANDNFRQPEIVAEYAQSCCSIAEECGVACLDLHSAMLARDDWQSFLKDGVHLSAMGNKFLADSLLAVIEKRFPHLAADSPNESEGEQRQPNPLPHHLPDNTDIGEDIIQVFSRVSGEIGKTEANPARILEIPAELRKKA
eukprot:CAMPEP_0197653368 /NCGR_PEP_ID=MMETSP1338-20131121/35243_1 /TAXON_ID=43686 ORGANISM="Pelagodinium beii, Strain RCC1491" /NCGR_SAMPLE_ID=MMETSP1338 /ASSEMBLY_ACC=CAM_ASM_000754 /LENGTH=244 /DNA_ID=CAMNT_0043228451 /DNA_START=155 /DNA_END=889 /DNA_ORIENTATION=-